MRPGPGSYTDKQNIICKRCQTLPEEVDPVSMLPIMCVFPLPQRHFVKGMPIGVIKA